MKDVSLQIENVVKDEFEADDNDLAKLEAENCKLKHRLSVLKKVCSEIVLNEQLNAMIPAILGNCARNDAEP